jgi:hypothetical protein
MELAGAVEPVHTWYIPLQWSCILVCSIFYITYQYVLGTYWYILVHTGMYQIPWITGQLDILLITIE